MSAIRKWRRTAVELNGKPIPLRDNWSLYDPSTNLEIARISRTPNGDWKYIVRTIRDNELKDESMGWMKIGPEAKAYCEQQTNWRNYRIGRKRTKEEILNYAGVRPKPKKQG